MIPPLDKHDKESVCMRALICTNDKYYKAGNHYVCLTIMFEEKVIILHGTFIVVSIITSNYCNQGDITQHAQIPSLIKKAIDCCAQLLITKVSWLLTNTHISWTVFHVSWWFSMFHVVFVALSKPSPNIDRHVSNIQKLEPKQTHKWINGWTDATKCIISLAPWLIISQ